MSLFFTVAVSISSPTFPLIPIDVGYSVYQGRKVASKRDSINLVIFAEHSVISVKTEQREREKRRNAAARMTVIDRLGNYICRRGKGLWQKQKHHQPSSGFLTMYKAHVFWSFKNM